MTAPPLRFASARVEGAVQPLGAMLADCRFDLGGGRSARPFVTAPWVGVEALSAEVPGVLRGLSGEWPCVPFGMPGAPDGLPADWRGTEDGPAGAAADLHPHGYGANHDWTLMAEGAGGVLAAIGYPAPHPVRWLERTVRADDHGPALDFSLTVHVRQDTALPVGLHPVFRLPEDPDAARLHFAEGTRAWTYPVPVEPGRSRYRADQRAADPRALALEHSPTKLHDLVEKRMLQAIDSGAISYRPDDFVRSESALTAGGTADLAGLPRRGASEDLVLLTGTGGRIVLDDRAEGVRVTLTWDAEQLPGCLLWISNGGRAHSPWNGRFRGLGIEPVAAAFDLGVAASLARQPLNAAGIATSLAFRAGRPLTLTYRVECAALTTASSQASSRA